MAVNSKNKRNLEINIHESIRISDLPCSVRVISVSTALFEQARALSNANKPDLYKTCIVLCHTALEVEAARIESAYLKQSGLVDKAIGQLLYQKTNICKKSSISLFESITGKNVSNKLDSNNLGNMNKKRNDIIHKGKEVKKQEAKNAVDLCEKTLRILRETLAC